VTPSPVLRFVDRYFQFALLGLVATGFFALAGTGRLDAATITFTGAALLARACVLCGWLKFEIPQRAVSLAALAYVLFYPVDFLWISRDFFTATIHGVCFLAAVKILTGRSDRDLSYTGLVAFVELVAAALLSWHSSFLIWLVLALFFAVAVFTSSEVRRGLLRTTLVASPPSGLPWKLAGIAGIAVLGVLLITGVFFLIVPRTARAAAVLFPGTARLTGFSSVIDLGTFGAISKDNRAVIHVQTYGRPLPLNMKWRGATLSRFDGSRWFEPSPMAPEPIPFINGMAEVADRTQRSRRDGRRLLYRVDSTASSNGTLFIAGIPEYITLPGQAPPSQRLIRRSGNNWQAVPPGNDTLHYEVSSLLAQPLPEALTDRERNRNLAVPPIDIRIPALAREWGGEGTTLERVRRIESHLRRDFQYSLETPVLRGRDPLSRFLFIDKKGYCEYFASAMAVMLRSSGIPARVVTGFQSGYFNPVSGLNVIRASDAHAWVEGWFGDQGWVTFDPTPSTLAKESGILSRLNMYLDAADSVWQQWVLTYDLGHQATLAARLESFLRTTRQGPRTAPAIHPLDFVREHWAWICGLAGLGLLLWNLRWLWSTVRNYFWLRKVAAGQTSSHDAARLYELMLRKAKISRPPTATPAELAASIADQRVVAFTCTYNEARYGRDPKAIAQLAGMLRTWNQPNSAHDH